MRKNSLFILLAFCYFIFSLALSIISPFFPAFAESKEISSLMIGVIYSANPLGAVFSSLILGKILNDVHLKINYILQNNRFVFMVIGIILLSVGIYLFIITYYVSKIYIIIIGAFARFMNGLVELYLIILRDVLHSQLHFQLIFQCCFQKKLNSI